MAILVLGGAGYIGSHTALELVKAGNETILTTPMSRQRKQPLLLTVSPNGVMMFRWAAVRS